ncbi:hypothetical protein L209DRAFT_756608 [Thermothelomyces heterothallicus CBS 203.75]
MILTHPRAASGDAQARPLKPQLHRLGVPSDFVKRRRKEQEGKERKRKGKRKKRQV